MNLSDAIKQTIAKQNARRDKAIAAMAAAARVNGQLDHDGFYEGVEYSKCNTCNTSFRIDRLGDTKSNGHTITLCPWCRDDSKPWKNGRGA